MTNIVFIIIGKSFNSIDTLSNFDNNLYKKFIICSTNVSILKEYFLEKM